MRRTLQTLGYYLCGIDGKGRVVRVEERKTYPAALRLLAKHGGDFKGKFLVSRSVATDPKADDHGVIYFFDLNGDAVEVHNA